MTMTGSEDWNALQALWKGESLGGDAPAALRGRAGAWRQRLLRNARWDLGLLLAAIVLFVTLVRYGTQVERLIWGVGLPAFAVHAIIEWLALRRLQWQSAALGTTAYLAQTLECLRRRLQLVGHAWQLYGAMILLDVAIWLWRHAADPASVLALRERAVLTVFVFSVFSAALAAWSWAYAWRGRSERAALESLRAEYEPGR